MIDTLFLRPSLHFTSSHLNFTQLHFTALSFGLTPIKVPTAPFHLTSLHLSACQVATLLHVISKKTVPIPLTCVAYADSHLGTDKLLTFLQVHVLMTWQVPTSKKGCGIYQSWDHLQRGSICEIFPELLTQEFVYFS